MTVKKPLVKHRALGRNRGITSEVVLVSFARPKERSKSWFLFNKTLKKYHSSTHG
jgi:hypothetical protein